MSDQLKDQLKMQGINSAGFGIIPKLVMQDRELHAIAKTIYAYFCSYAGAGSVCFPTRSKICYDLNISNDTFAKYLKNLVRCGYVEVEQIKENGRFSHNVYTLCSTKSPCPKITVSENIGHGKLDTKNNSIKNNSLYKNKKEKEIYKEKEKGSFPLSDTFSNSKVEEKILEANKNEKNLKNSLSSKGNKKAPRITEEQLREEFQEVWDLYPRKQGRKAAYAAFVSARKKNTPLKEIREGIKQYRKYIENKKTSQEYIKQGSTFFNQNAWEDDWSLGNTSNSSHKIYCDDSNLSPEEQDKRETEELRRLYD